MDFFGGNLWGGGGGGGLDVLIFLYQEEIFEVTDLTKLAEFSQSP